MKEIKKCCICESIKKVCNSEIGLLCGKHYCQYKRTGKILTRTKYDCNEIIDNQNGTSYICLYNNKNKEVSRTIIDSSNVDRLKDYKWCLDKNNYVKNSKQEYLHRIICNELTLYIDHIDGNTLNNLQSNLRVCSNADNLKNRVKIPSNNTSGIIGVRFRSDRNKWYSEIRVDGETIRLGSYTNKEDAIKARKEAEEKYFKEFKPQINEIN